MDVRLIAKGGKNAGAEIPVKGPKFFIGRSEECQLRPASAEVSRHHAVLLVEEGYLGVRDFGSRNGTFVNDQPVRAEQELKNGDVLRVGPLEFEVALAVQLGGKKKPKVHSVQEAAARAMEVGSGEELDIFDLLGEEETVIIPNSPAPAEPAPEPVAEAPSEQPEPQPGSTERRPKKKGGGIVGQFKQKEPTSESSRSAADEMLKQLFRRP